MVMYPFDYIQGKPFVKVKFNEDVFDIQCLVDSGADYSVFPAVIGKEIGIDFHDYDLLKENVSGLTGDVKCKKWRVSLPIYINDITESITIEAIFVNSKKIENILGRKTFFNKFKEVIFDEENKKVIFKK